ncbi:MAG: NRDE family protein [Planctomycetota bacterium]
MCTLTIVPVAGGPDRTLRFRVVFNRDERRNRRPGEAPRLRRVAGRTAIWPLDPAGGGTWIAVNESGLVFSLLNRTPNGDGKTWLGPDPNAKSRGRLIPALVASDSLESIANRIRSASEGITRGFRLVVTDGRRILEAEGGLDQVAVPVLRSLDGAFFRTSSSLGDDLVFEPRRRLFVERFGSWLEGPAADASSARTVQDQFHQSTFEGRGEISVSMTRADARTVSATCVEVHDDRIVVAHRDGGPAAPISKHLEWPTATSQSSLEASS